MRYTSDERMRQWVVDYSAARAKAIAWLGERYLLAKPVKRQHRLPAQRRHPVNRAGDIRKSVRR